MKKIYFDYAASTPVHPEVLHAMEPYFSDMFGNPGSLHSFGQEAIKAIGESRDTIAKAIGAKFSEIIFTGSATEANNLALRGALRAFRFELLGLSSDKKNLKPKTYNLKPRIIVSAIEHESILETARDLERDGAEIIYLPVDRRGIVDLVALKESLNERTILLSIMYANNEIGTIQPIREIAEIIADFRNKKEEKLKDKNSTFYILNSKFYPLFHADAAQAFQFLDCDVNKLGVDLMTLSAHKIYGPKGVGAFYVRNLKPNTYNLKPIVTGGGQEFGSRSGTENVPSIVGFAEATKLLFSNSQEHGNRKIAKLRDYFWAELKKIYPKAELNSTEESSLRLPNILNIYFPDHEAQFLLTKLDLAGVAASSGSACRSRAVETSHVIEALGHSRERAKRSIRFSFGRPTTEKEIKEALKILQDCLA